MKKKLLGLFLVIVTLLVGAGFLSWNLFDQTKSNRILARGLTVSSANGYDDEVEYLLSKGKNPNQADQDGDIPLVVLMESKKFIKDENFYRCLKLLLDNAANPEVKDKNGTPLVVIAAKNRDLQSIRMLIQHGAKIDALDASGNKAEFYWDRVKSVEKDK